MLQQMRETALVTRLQTSWRDARRVGQIAIDAAYRFHAALTVDPSPINGGWQVVDSDSLSDSDEVTERDVASDNDGLFDTEPLVDGYDLPDDPDLDSASDKDPGTSCDASPDDNAVSDNEYQSFSEAESYNGPETYYNARSGFDDGFEGEQLPTLWRSSASRLLATHASSQPAATRPGLCSALEQGQILEVEGSKGKGKRRAEKYRTHSTPGGFPPAQPIPAPSRHQASNFGLSRRSSLLSNAGFVSGRSSIAASSSSARPPSLPGTQTAESSAGPSPFTGAPLGERCITSARPRSPRIPPWPPVPPLTPFDFDRFDPKLKAKIVEVKRQHRADRYKTDAEPSSASSDTTLTADEGPAEPEAAGAKTR